MTEQLQKRAKTEDMKAQEKALKKQYDPKNIKQVIEKQIIVNDKTKIFSVIEYRNGVTKRRLIEVIKKGHKRKTPEITKEYIQERFSKKRK